MHTCPYICFGHAGWWSWTFWELALCEITGKIGGHNSLSVGKGHKLGAEKDSRNKVFFSLYLFYIGALDGSLIRF